MDKGAERGRAKKKRERGNERKRKKKETFEMLIGAFALFSRHHFPSVWPAGLSACFSEEKKLKSS